MTATVCDGSPRTLQQAASRALVELLGLDLAELNWHVPQTGAAAGTLVGVCDGGEVPERVDAVDAWAHHLRVTPVWRRASTGTGGEYCAAGEHQGAPVIVRAWLPEAPMEANA